MSLVECGCIHGCVCKRGMIRSSKTQKCITIAKCEEILMEASKAPFHCGENEQYSERNAGCQSSCYSSKLIENCPPSSGCVCNDGFIRDGKNGTCIQLEKCPRCRPNEEWIPCDNCTTIQCQDNCGICQCRYGYIRHNLHCVRDCADRICLDNEEFLECGNCENCCFNNPRTTCDKNNCYEGCFCKEPLVRNPLTELCVEYKSCPRKLKCLSL